MSIGALAILAKLGQVGMGVVYKARDVNLDRIVALKMIVGKPAVWPELRTRFAGETSALAGLEHPNIVRLYEYGEDDGTPFFAQEFVDGRSLEQVLNKQPLQPRDAAGHCETLARAVQQAHDRNVIHRDLKPANVLRGADGTLKITDFGLARKLDEPGQTQTGAVMGTPSYMAPEQAEGKKDIGAAADVYALGAILYECLTGRPPFVTGSVLETLEQVRRRDPPA